MMPIDDLGDGDGDDDGDEVDDNEDKDHDDDDDADMSYTCAASSLVAHVSAVVDAIAHLNGKKMSVKYCKNIAQILVEYYSNIAQISLKCYSYFT